MPPRRGVLYEQMERLPLSQVPSPQAIELNEVNLVGIGNAVSERTALLDASERLPWQEPIGSSRRAKSSKRWNMRKHQRPHAETLPQA